MQPRICFIHIGTHKTASTALQFFLDENRVTFQQMGLTVLNTGRETFSWENHDLAWDLLAERAQVRLAQLRAELLACEASCAILTAEDFSLLHNHPAAIRDLVTTIQSAGHHAAVIAFLRDQASYADSMYGQRFRSKEPAHGYDAYLHHVLNEGTFTTPDGGIVLFDYERLLEPFSAACGPERVAVRAYEPWRGPGHIYRDFLAGLATIAPDLPLASWPLHVAHLNVNERLPFIAILGTIFARLFPEIPLPDDPRDFLRDIAPELDPAIAFGPYTLMLYDEAVAILERFSPSNHRVMQRYGCQVAPDDLCAFLRPGDERWDLARTQRAIYDRCVARWLAGIPHPAS